MFIEFFCDKHFLLISLSKVRNRPVHSYGHFQGKKYVSQILSNLLKRQIGSRYPTVEYIMSKRQQQPDQNIIMELMLGYI